MADTIRGLIPVDSDEFFKGIIQWLVSAYAGQDTELAEAFEGIAARLRERAAAAANPTPPAKAKAKRTRRG